MAVTYLRNQRHKIRLWFLSMLIPPISKLHFAILKSERQFDVLVSVKLSLTTGLYQRYRQNVGDVGPGVNQICILQF